MAPDDKPRPERELTNESLRIERERTDSALAETQRNIEEAADLVVERAREHADDVLVAARAKADEAVPAATPAVLKERALQDEELRGERAAADASIERERAEDSLALARLLPLEREKTDKYLLTERVRSDDSIAHRDDFLGIVSHDLRALLGGIVLSASHLAETIADKEGSEATLVGTARIQRYAARMNRLIGDLLDVASIDAGKLALQPSRGDLAALVKEAAETFKVAATTKGITLETEHAEAEIVADFDHDRLLQVLVNLVTNSIKFTPAGGRIVLQGARVGDELRLSIRDTGPGIPADMLEAVFQRFWQVGKNDRRGLGLGLYISRCIVEAHGGRIWAESTPGQGSLFSVVIPV